MLTTSKDKIGRDFISRLEEIYKNLLICSNSKKINVAMRFNRMDAEYNNERTFFLNLSKNSNLIENDRSNFSSYKLAFSSSIIVAMDSTLAFEMFGSGKRVLFCDFAKPLHNFFAQNRKKSRPNYRGSRSTLRGRRCSALSLK